MYAVATVPKSNSQHRNYPKRGGSKTRQRMRIPPKSTRANSISFALGILPELLIGWLSILATRQTVGGLIAFRLAPIGLVTLLYAPSLVI